MNQHNLVLAATICILAVVLTPASARGQDESAVPEYLKASIDTEHRAIRRDIPLTDAIRRAMDQNTRDFTGRPGSDYWQLQTDYTIEVSLDPQTQILSGSETIVIHNNSNDELTEILLHLDHNIFRGLVPRGSSIPAENTEGMVITKLLVNGENVDLYARRPRRSRGQPASSATLSVSGLDQTIARISLPDPIAAKSTATLEIDWNTKLPGGPSGRAHRMTQRWGNTLFQPTQWFPRVAKYDDLRGWETNAYLGPAEFYNNFGRFDVKIDMPGGWIVSGTGVLQNPADVLTARARAQLDKVLDSDETITIVGEHEVGPGKSTLDKKNLTWHFVAENVNDFAWATAENFIWKATRATIPEKGPIPIHMVYLPKNAGLFENAAARTRHALEFYSALWTPYPFPQLTLQDGPSAGMEYPMVINSNQGAADHETAHQWWPMMLGTNETRYGWMDEGFNTYMNILSRADSDGEVADLTGRGQSYGRMSGNEDEPTMMWTSNYGGDLYRYQTYQKAPLMLAMLGGLVGDEAVQQAMSEYTRAWAFKHPSPWDFAFFMSNALEQDLGWFWYYWLWTTESVDGSIQEVTTLGDDTIVRVRQDGQMPSPIILEIQLAEGGPLVPSVPGATMVDEHTVIVQWSVEVWFDGNREFDARLTFGDRKIKKITLDPEGRFPDRNPDDNVWTNE